MKAVLYSDYICDILLVAEEKMTAIALWHKLGYGICPAIMRGDSLADDYKNERIPGVYAVKVLRSN